MNKDFDYKQCPDCLGDGRVEYQRPVADYVHGGYINTYLDTCDTCNGSGEIVTTKELSS